MPDIILGTIALVFSALVYLRCLWNQSKYNNTNEQQDILVSPSQNSEIPPSYQESEQQEPPSYDKR